MGSEHDPVFRASEADACCSPNTKKVLSCFVDVHEYLVVAKNLQKRSYDSLIDLCPRQIASVNSSRGKLYY